jgi:anti-sigma factor RsiW
MTCDELLRALNDYIDDESALAMYREFAEHLAGCNPCQLVIDNIRKTIQLFRAGEPYPMPAAFQERFRQALREQWKKRFPQAAV